MPADVVKQIGKRHPLLIPPFTNDTLRRAVEDYLAGGARKERIVDKYGDINNWDVSRSGRCQPGIASLSVISNSAKF